MTIEVSIFWAMLLLCIVAWLAGMFVPKLRRSWLSTCGAALVFVPGVLEFMDAPVHLIGFRGEAYYAFAIPALLMIPVGIICLTLALTARAKLRPFGTIEEEF
ncbi:hypothetical protein [Altererythrobacter sp. GH1-8]|uniref:hypothetical protein n=1 Tax=Altererythrobacter sp. GH1-8 TaxID=3349333 RepID=UPI00374D079B